MKMKFQKLKWAVMQMKIELGLGDGLELILK